MIWWRIAQRIKPHLTVFYRRLSQPPVPNLEGDRDIEHSWVAANMTEGTGRALDFGCLDSWMGLLAARRGFEPLQTPPKGVVLPLDDPAKLKILLIKTLDLLHGHRQLRLEPDHDIYIRFCQKQQRIFFSLKLFLLVDYQQFYFFQFYF